MNTLIKNKFIIVLFVMCFIGQISCKKELSSDNKHLLNAGHFFNISDSSYTQILSKGINLSNWFIDGGDKAQYNTRFTEDHFKKVKQKGFTFVRLPIGFYTLFTQSAPTYLHPGNIKWVDSAVARATRCGLAVIIDHHPGGHFYEQEMMEDKSGKLINNFALYWKTLAAYFSKYSTKQVMFEVLNEPYGSARSTQPNAWKWWWPAQEKVVRAIREAAPNHIVIVEGEEGGSATSLIRETPYNIPNVVYAFHYYLPAEFTHQGAYWVGVPYNLLRNVPYPSSPENVGPVINASADRDVQWLLHLYGKKLFNQDSIQLEMDLVHKWSLLHKAFVVCTEFGSYKPFSPRENRLQYITDVRTKLEAAKFGWAMWELDEGFGIIDYPNNNRNMPVFDNEMLTALGLK